MMNAKQIRRATKDELQAEIDAAEARVDELRRQAVSLRAWGFKYEAILKRRAMVAGRKYIQRLEKALKAE